MNSIVKIPAAISAFCRKRARLCVSLFFAVLLLAGLCVSGDYGLPFDELAEQVILQENLNEYAHQLLGADSEAVAYYNRLGIDRISESIERDHGQSAYYAVAPILPLASTAPDRLSALWHAYTWLWFMVGVLAIYGFGREMGWSRPIACITALLLFLSPRFFAEGHYNNKDMVLLSLFLLTLWLGLRLFKKPGYLRGLLFSLAGAMATNTKIIGIFPWGLIGLGMIGIVTARKAWDRRMVGIALATLASFVLIYALLTPALWPNPAEYLAYLLQNASGFTRWKGYLIYKGMFIDQQKAPIPRLYLPTMMLITLPLYTLVLAAAGQLRALWDAARAIKQKKALADERCWMIFILTLCWLLPLGYAIVSRPIVYNGWRHFYFVYAGIVLLAGHGISALSQWLTQLKTKAKPSSLRAHGHKLATLLLCLCFAISAAGIIANHPYQYGYYNLLARKTAATDMEMDYWNVSIVNAMHKLASHPDRDQSLPLVIGSRDELCGLGLTFAHSVLPEPLRNSITVLTDENAPYLLFNTTYSVIFKLSPPEGYHPLFTIDSYGNVLCTVYERIES